MFDPKLITTIVFDLDDTLRHNQPQAHTFISDFAETLRDKPLTIAERRAGQRWEHGYWANSDDLLNDIAKYTEGTPEFWLNYSRRSLRSLGFSPDLAEQYSMQLREYMRGNYKPVDVVHPETFHTLEELRRRGYTTGLLTNRPKPIHAEMHRIALDLHMDFFLTASQLGAYKPNKEIFDGVLKFIGRPAQELLYVGDNYYADIIGARNAGLHCLLLNWNDLYENPDCDQIKAISELLTIFQPEAIR
jgi:putative hydrolase of the HAD superfamily